ncbi:hypothetical protein OS493_003814 [Desmophyllum pertusum]|uniref:Uncharacterized protein n=1 Tax=Desmophyllum pertusum TaxID=174260 RepID=A0A9X0DC14_9CNID|nr:hypothetical protein OS493_003814 [Desmophyllum pertusum]
MRGYNFNTIVPMKARLSLKQTIAELLIQLLVKVIYKMKCILSFRNKFKELQMKSTLIAFFCCLLFAVSLASDNPQAACYDKCNKEHMACVNDCVISDDNSFQCLWKCRNDYYGCTAGCYKPPIPGAQ